MTEIPDDIDPYRAYKARQTLVAQGLADSAEPLLRLSVQEAEAAASSAAQWEREKQAEAAARAAREIREVKCREAADRLEVQRSLRWSSWWMPVVGFIGVTLAVVLVSEGFSYGVCMFSPGNTHECYREANRAAERPNYDERENNYRSE